MSTPANNTEFDPKITSSFESLEEEIEANVAKKDKVTVKTLLHLIRESNKRIEKLEREKQELNGQIAKLQNEKTELQEAKSSEYTERKRTFDVNVDLRRRLQGFYELSVIMSLAFILADIFIDVASIDLTGLLNGQKWEFGFGICLRCLGVLAILISAYVSWRSFRSNEERTRMILREDETDK